MKFLKFSIVLVFLLSLLGAGTSVYLSTLRENEKAKRVYLEGVKTDLEKRVQTLESAKAELGQKVTDLELKNRDLDKQLDSEKQNYQHAMDLMRDKDIDLKTLRQEAEEAHKAFENAQKRNEELERILDELESRMRQVEVQKIPPGSEAGFVEVSVAPVNSGKTNNSQPSEVTQPETPSATKKEEVTQTTAIPMPSKSQKRKRFFSFFHSSKEKGKKVEEPKKEAESTPAVGIAKSTPVVTEKLKESALQTPQKEPEIKKEVEPVTFPKSEAKTEVQPSPAKVETQVDNKMKQTIAAGGVLLVNRKYNFIVINLGSKHGLAMDDILSVQHKGVEIAKARVEKLYDDYSAAYIVEERSNQPIGEGDAVTAV